MKEYGIKPEEEGGLLPWTFVSEAMDAARNYWLATTRPDGGPHVAPVWGLWHADCFFFSTGSSSVKAGNLAADPRAVLHLESGDEVVILNGRVAAEEDQDLLKELDQRYQTKYAVSLLGGTVYRLELTQALAWREAEFPTTATRWDFD